MKKTIFRKVGSDRGLSGPKTEQAKKAKRKKELINILSDGCSRTVAQLTRIVECLASSTTITRLLKELEADKRVSNTNHLWSLLRDDKLSHNKQEELSEGYYFCPHCNRKTMHELQPQSHIHYETASQEEIAELESDVILKCISCNEREEAAYREEVYGE